jgi:hypothetical protein
MVWPQDDVDAQSMQEYRFSPTDLGSVITAMYAAISGPAGPRDWDAETRLFHPEARMMRTEVDAAGRPVLKIMTRAQYRENTEPFLAANSFYEREIDRRVETFGCIAHVWSAYEARTRPTDETPERRGVNLIQLARDGRGHWRIVSMIWDNEREGVKLQVF